MSNNSETVQTNALAGIKWESPTYQDIFYAAMAYVEAGLSLIPIRANGHKTPMTNILPRINPEQRGRRTWTVLRQRMPTETELRFWFDDGYMENPRGLAIVAGEISGGLEIIDLDNWDVVEPWCDRVEELAPGLLYKLVAVETPRPGLHMYYRCGVYGSNQKLARIPEVDDESGEVRPKTLVEVKGEGGYCLAPPSPPACHPRDLSYLYQPGRVLTQIATITAEEREILFTAARELNKWDDSVPFVVPRQQSHPVRGDRPGDDFNSRAESSDILTPHNISGRIPVPGRIERNTGVAPERSQESVRQSTTNSRACYTFSPRMPTRSKISADTPSSTPSRC